MKKTKIICTIGPKSDNWETFKELVLAGMNVARINFSHANMEFVNNCVNLVKKANKELNTNIGIMYDTKGPDLRTGVFINDEIRLIKGNTIKIVEEDIIGNEQKFSLNYRNIVSKINIGDKVLVDDGFYSLKVIEKNLDSITCQIENSGTIKSKRGVCIPGVNLNLPFISKDDEEDIKIACENDGDYLACSFVNTKKDIEKVRQLCKKYGNPNIKIISKIETKIGIKNLNSIIDVSDYIMIARGDLSIEAGYEHLPLYQKNMIDLCHKKSKGVIMATQMMYSMVENIRPTNAEVTDVSNAILSGCDAIMTSDETTIGKYPVETVKTMNNICLSTEKITKYNLDEYKLLGTDIHNTIARCSIHAAKNLPIKAIIVSTISGKTAIDISSLRPNSIIIANTISEKVSRSLSLKWGIYSSIIPTLDNTDEIVEAGIKEAKKIMKLKKGDLVAIVGSSPSTAHTNFLKIEEI